MLYLSSVYIYTYKSFLYYILSLTFKSIRRNIFSPIVMLVLKSTLLYLILLFFILSKDIYYTIEYSYNKLSTSFCMIIFGLLLLALIYLFYPSKIKNLYKDINIPMLILFSTVINIIKYFLSSYLPISSFLFLFIFAFILLDIINSKEKGYKLLLFSIRFLIISFFWFNVSSLSCMSWIKSSHIRCDADTSSLMKNGIIKSPYPWSVIEKANIHNTEFPIKHPIDYDLRKFAKWPHWNGFFSIDRIDKPVLIYNELENTLIWNANPRDSGFQGTISLENFPDNIRNLNTGYLHDHTQAILREFPDPEELNIVKQEKYDALLRKFTHMDYGRHILFKTNSLHKWLEMYNVMAWNVCKDLNNAERALIYIDTKDPVYKPDFEYYRQREMEYFWRGMYLALSKNFTDLRELYKISSEHNRFMLPLRDLSLIDEVRKELIKDIYYRKFMLLHFAVPLYYAFDKDVESLSKYKFLDGINSLYKLLLEESTELDFLKVNLMDAYDTTLPEFKFNDALISKDQLVRVFQYKGTYYDYSYYGLGSAFFDLKEFNYLDFVHMQKNDAFFTCEPKLKSCYLNDLDDNIHSKNNLYKLGIDKLKIFKYNKDFYSKYKISVKTYELGLNKIISKKLPAFSVKKFFMR